MGAHHAAFTYDSTTDTKCYSCPPWVSSCCPRSCSLVTCVCRRRHRFGASCWAPRCSSVTCRRRSQVNRRNNSHIAVVVLSSQSASEFFFNISPAHFPILCIGAHGTQLCPLLDVNKPICESAFFDLCWVGWRGHAQFSMRMNATHLLHNAPNPNSPDMSRGRPPLRRRRRCDCLLRLRLQPMRGGRLQRGFRRRGQVLRF